MKKQLIALFLGISFVLSFVSCNKYEESMYNKSDYQIRYIWHKSKTGDPNEIFTYDKHNMLTSITNTDTSDVSDLHNDAFEFSYNKDKTVKSISYNNGTTTEVIEFAYLNKYVKYMSYAVDGQVYMISNFYRDDEKAAKITRIVETYEREFFEELGTQCHAQLFDYFIGNRQRIMDLMSGSQYKGLTLYCTKTVTYEGENITMITEDYPDLRKSVLTTMTYGNILNPYHGLNYVYSKDLLGFSKNAPTSKITATYYDKELANTETQEFSYPDVNKDNYPRIYITSSSKHAGISFKTYINYNSEYKK